MLKTLSKWLKPDDENPFIDPEKEKHLAREKPKEVLNINPYSNVSCSGTIPRYYLSEDLQQKLYIKGSGSL